MPVESTSKSYCSNKSCPLSLSSSRNSLWLLHHSKKEFRFCLHGQHAQRSNKASTILLGCGMWEVTGWDWNRNDFFCIHILCKCRIYTPLYEETFNRIGTYIFIVPVVVLGWSTIWTLIEPQTIRSPRIISPENYSSIKLINIYYTHYSYSAVWIWYRNLHQFSRNRFDFTEITFTMPRR